MAFTINEENGTTVQNLQATTVQNPESTTDQNSLATTVQCNTTPPNKSHKVSMSKQFVKIWKNITVEPLMLCWLVPTCFLVVLVENLTLEKVSCIQFQFIVSLFNKI